MRVGAHGPPYDEDVRLLPYLLRSGSLRQRLEGTVVDLCEELFAKRLLDGCRDEASSESHGVALRAPVSISMFGCSRERTSMRLCC